MRSLWWSLSIVPIGVMNSSFWALIHEAIHELLNTNATVNAGLGRVLAICFASPFQILRLTQLSIKLNVIAAQKPVPSAH